VAASTIIILSARDQEKQKVTLLITAPMITSPKPFSTPSY